MSMINIAALNQPTPSPRQYCLLEFLLAIWARDRRRALGMSVERAAELAGMAISEWCALEVGWVPEKESTLQAIAGTLETRYGNVSMKAWISRYHQELFSDPSLQAN